MSLRVALTFFGLVSGDQPDTGLTGTTNGNVLSDQCWKNITLSATGKRGLVITTSHGDPLSDGKDTGVAYQEAIVPYYVYSDAGMQVDLASIKGGQIPIGDSTPTPKQLRGRLDKTATAKFSNSLKIDDVDFAEYDVVFMAGGWGAAFDLGFSQVLGKKVAAALEAKTPLLASVCHGSLGFRLANMTDGTPWVTGRAMTGVTNAQIEKLGVKGQTPLHPEEELRNAGANYQSIHGTNILLKDLSASAVAVDAQGPVIVTGQNQNSACVTAQRQLLFLLSQTVMLI